nr:reverse transcriptase domain-containing protein [Tanacetum cinerariifolium]
MNPIATQQAAFDNALVPSEKRLKIERCNARIAFTKPQKEETYQVTLEALKLSPCYPAFQITTMIPDGMINDDIKLSKAYKTYLDYATGKVPLKKAMKFKKPASPKLKIVHASPKEPTQKGSLPSNTVPNPRADVKAITTWSGVTLAGTSVSPPPSKEVDQEPELIPNQKLPEKLGDPGKFLIPCDFPKFDECLALADLGASINLMSLSIWKKLSLPELTSTRALIDIYGEELTLRVDDEVITFKVGQTSKYSYNDAESINQIDVIDVACEEYVQEVLGFSDKSKSGSPTLTLDPIISSSSPSFTPFEGSDFILEEIETFLQTLDEFSNLDNDYYDTEGDILYLEKVLNEDPSPNIPLVKTEDLNQVNATMTKPLIEEPLELELKELPSHLEYTFLKGTDKLPVIISKELKDEEKSAL